LAAAVYLPETGILNIVERVPVAADTALRYQTEEAVNLAAN
jgi:hypothetical protein